MTNQETLARLKVYFKSLTAEQQEKFAIGCGTTRGQFLNLCYGTRKIAPEMAVAIDRECKGTFRMEDLCPEPGIDWSYIKSVAGRKNPDKG